jgi:hypothetical protein
VRVEGRWYAVEKDGKEFWDWSTASVSGPMGELYAKEHYLQFGGAGSGQRENYVQTP